MSEINGSTFWFSITDEWLQLSSSFKFRNTAKIPFDWEQKQLRLSVRVWLYEPNLREDTSETHSAPLESTQRFTYTFFNTHSETMSLAFNLFPNDQTPTSFTQSHSLAFQPMRGSVFVIFHTVIVACNVSYVSDQERMYRGPHRC